MNCAPWNIRAAWLGLAIGLCTAGAVNAGAEPGCPGDACPGAVGEGEDPLADVVVTGSHIRGIESAGSNLLVIGREQIDASGRGRVEDVLATLTQNFNRANPAVGEPGFFNLNHGAEVQLRGLGVGTTLALVNGQRQGASGWQGSFTDVSMIPVSAIERIEVLPEGTSALYGSDAVGGVVNIVLRMNLDGVEASVRGSTAGGNARERSAALVAGREGPRGHLLAGFQVNDSDALPCAARAPCAANADLRHFGGSDLRGFGGNPGTVLDPVTLRPVAAIPRGQDGMRLTAAQLVPGTVNHTDNVTGNDILPGQSMRSAFVSASSRLSERWELSADGRYSRRDFVFSFPIAPIDLLVPGTNAFNHLGGPALVAYDLSRDFGPVEDRGPTTNAFASAALKGSLPRGWQLAVTGSYARATTEFIERNFTLDYAAIDEALASTDPATALNVFGDGSHSSAAVLAALRARNHVSDDLNVVTASSANVIADGPLFNGRAGAIRLAAGGEVREEHSTGTNIAELPEDRRRLIHSGFFELAVPVVGARGSTAGARLDVSLAGRYDHYSDVGGTFNPKLGFSWRPFSSMKLRGNWGTSFLAPPYFWSNRDQVGDTWVSDVVDPGSPTGYTHALQLWGPAPDLRPERARAWNAGVDVAIPAFGKLSLSLTYFDIDYQGKIQPPNPDTQFYLTQEAQLAPLITRNPTRAQVDAACTKPPLSGGSCDQAIAVILDGRYRNLASLKTRGVDALLGDEWNTTLGKVSAGLNGTYTIDQRRRIAPAAPEFDLVDTVGNPPSVRLALALSWSLRHWSLQSTVNHTGAYRDPATVPVRRVDAWTTVDLNLGWQAGDGAGPMANTQFNLGIDNALDQHPPFVNRFDLPSGALGYDPANANLLGRQVSLRFVKRWGH